MTDPKELVEKAERFIKQQQDLYGKFTVSIPVSGEPEADQEKKSEINTKSSEPQSTDTQHTKTEDQETVQTKTEKPLSTQEKIAACQTLDELKSLCEQTPDLQTDLEGTNLVFGVGNPDADLMIVGEAPGYNEDQQGEPFVGEAGQLLDKIMDAINFKRNDIYIANILKHRPPNNRDPKPEEREKSLPYLLRQIELVDPKIILCVGRISATTLLGDDTSLSKLRGSTHPFHGRELMATYHPAALLRNPKWKRPTWEDVQKLRKRYDELGGR